MHVQNKPPQQGVTNQIIRTNSPTISLAYRKTISEISKSYWLNTSQICNVIGRWYRCENDRWPAHNGHPIVRAHKLFMLVINLYTVELLLHALWRFNKNV